jgi:hypothetical protein
MAHSENRPAALIALAGLILVLLGAAALFVGLTLAERLYALLPPVTIDAAAVGGATVAFGVASALLGMAHGVLALGLRRAVPTATVPAIVLCATMAVVSVGWAVAALVSAASGSAPAAAMLAAGIGLLLVALAYGWAGAVLMRLRRKPVEPD